MTAAVSLAGCLSAPPESVDPPDGPGDGWDNPWEEDGGGGGWWGMDLVPAGPETSTVSVGGGGGDPFAVSCPEDRFITGLAGLNNGAGITAVWARCSRFQVDDDTIERVDTVDSEHVVGDPDSTALAPVDCSPGLVGVGFAGSINFNQVVGHLQLLCAPIAWNGYMASIGAASEETAVLGELDEAGLGDGPCGNGRAAAGIAGRVGLLVDQFRLECYAVEARPAE